MLIGEVRLSGDYVVLCDVDGTEVKLTAIDTLYVEEWIHEHKNELLEVVRRQKPHRTFQEPLEGISGI